MTTTIAATQAPTGAVAFKYTDPTEDARWIYDGDEAVALIAEGAPVEMVELAR